MEIFQILAERINDGFVEIAERLCRKVRMLDIKRKADDSEETALDIVVERS